MTSIIAVKALNPAGGIPPVRQGLSMQLGTLATKDIKVLLIRLLRNLWNSTLTLLLCCNQQQAHQNLQAESCTEVMFSNPPQFKASDDQLPNLESHFPVILMTLIDQ